MGRTRGEDVTAEDLLFILCLIGFDIKCTLHEVLSKKLCNPDVSTWFWSCIEKQLAGLLE